MYDGLFGAVLEPGREALARVVTGCQPPRLLEIGVGTGLTLKRYPELTAVHGIDVSAEMLARARERAAGLLNRQIEIREMDAEQLGYADNYFDCVTIPYVLSVTPNPSKLIAEARRVCKPQGTIVIVNHFSGERGWTALERVFASLASMIGFHSIFSYAENIAVHDWKIISVKKVNLFSLSKMLVINNDKLA